MHYPISIKRSLKTLFTFGIRVGLSTKSGVATAKGAVESFAVVGMDVTFLDILNRVGMFRDGSLIFGPLPTFFTRLRAFVFHSYFDPFPKSLAGASPFAVSDQFMTDLEQDVAISTFPIRDQGNVLCFVHEFFQKPESLSEELAVFLAALEFPKKATGPVHEHYGPTHKDLCQVKPGPLEKGKNS